MPPPAASAQRRREMKRAGECKLPTTSGTSLPGDRIRGRVTILYDGVRLEQAEKFVLSIATGHAGHVIADGALRPIITHAATVALRQQSRRTAKLVEELTNDPAAFDGHALDAIVIVHTPAQELFQVGLECLHFRTRLDQDRRGAADIGDAADTLLPQSLPGVFEQVAHLPVDEITNHGGLELLGGKVAVTATDLFEDTAPELDVAQVGRDDQADTEGVVDVVGVVGETVDGV